MTRRELRHKGLVISDVRPSGVTVRLDSQPRINNFAHCVMELFARTMFAIRYVIKYLQSYIFCYSYFRLIGCKITGWILLAN